MFSYVLPENHLRELRTSRVASDVPRRRACRAVIEFVGRRWGSGATHPGCDAAPGLLFLTQLGDAAGLRPFGEIDEMCDGFCYH